MRLARVKHAIVYIAPLVGYERLNSQRRKQGDSKLFLIVAILPSDQLTLLINGSGCIAYVTVTKSRQWTK